MSDLPGLSITLGAFALILVLARVKVPLSVAVLAGAGAVGLLFKRAPGQILQTAGEGLIQPQTIGLIIVVTCLLALSGTMQVGGQMRRIVSLTRALLRRRVVTMAALPALIGLLPMPGGALFSAPMVESAAGGQDVPRGKLSAINYWFRHVWEYWWPLYPGVILAMTLTGLNFASFAMFQLPMSIFMIAAGLLILRKTHPSLHVSAPPPPKGTKRSLLQATSSIWLVLLVWGGLKLALVGLIGPAPQRDPSGSQLTWGEGAVVAIHNYLPITLGLLASLIWTHRLNRLTAGAIRKVWTDTRICKTAALIASIMIFQHMLAHVGAPDKISDELTQLHVPVLAVLVILPFIAGLVTGVAVGFVGTSFPIVLGLIGNSPGAGSIAPYIVLAYASGQMGLMLSPLHLCHVMSNKYFKTSFGPVYRQIVPAALVTGALTVAYFVTLKLAMGK